MGKKAWMKYVRELCGLSQLDLADACGVHVQSVKRWEKSTCDREPPEDVLAWLQGAMQSHNRDRCELVDSVRKRAGDSDTVFFTWYPDQESCDLDGNQVPYGYKNAVTRSAAEQLVGYGYNIVMIYPDEEIPHLQEVD